MQLSPEELTRYTQQIKLNFIGIHGQLKLKTTRLLCIGAGGLGSSLLLYLSAAGIGTLGIMDNDKVELNNLQRQVLYKNSHIGTNKALVAKHELNSLNPSINIHAIPFRLRADNAPDLFNKYDIIADCTDNYQTHYLINDVARIMNKPFAYASITGYQGQCIFFPGTQSACLRCLFPKPPPEYFTPSCQEGAVLGITPGFFGLIQATKIIQWILDLNSDVDTSLITMNILEMKSQKYSFKKSSLCTLCNSDLSARSTQSKENSLFQYAINMHELLYLKHTRNILLLDVRTNEEHQKFNLGGISIPLQQLSAQLDQLDQKKLIIIYCQSGVRSLQALRILLDANFHSLRYLKDELNFPQ